MKKLFLSALCLVAFSSAYSQNETCSWDKLGWRFGIFGGTTFFAGDIMEDYGSAISDMHYQGGVSIEKYLCKNLDFRFNAWYGTLRGTKEVFANGNLADLYFNGKSFNYNVNLKFDFLRAIANPDMPVSMYLTAGVGRDAFSATLKKISSDAIVNESKDACFVVPVGVGLNYRVNEHWNFNLEAIMHLATSDALDAREINFNNKKLKDMYAIASLGFTYTFISRPQEPTIVETPVTYEEAVEETPAEDSTVAEIPEFQEDLQFENEPIQAEPQVVQEVVKPVVEEKPQPKESYDDKIVPDLCYKIQILAVRADQDKTGYLKKHYPIVNDVISEVDSDGMKKYYVNQCLKTLSAANEYRDYLQKNNLKNPFVVPFYNGKRISNAQALELREK